MIAGCGECCDLMAPGVSQFRPTVTEDQGLAFAQGEYFEFHAIRRDSLCRGK
jgi:hypothetical protein